MGDHDVIRDLLVRFGVKVTPTTKQALVDFDALVEKVRASMDSATKSALRLAGAFSAAAAAARAAGRAIHGPGGASAAAPALAAVSQSGIARQATAAARQQARAAATAARQQAKAAAAAIREQARAAATAAKEQAAAATQAAATAVKQLQTAKGLAEDLAGFALRAGTTLVGAGLAAAAATGLLAVSTGQHATAVERQARAMNLTTKEYQELLFVFESFGATDQDMADTLLQINDASQRAQGGAKEMVANFNAIGITMADLKGLNPSQIFDLLADRISKTTDKAKAMSVMSQLLGEESGRKLGPALMQGAGAIRAMRLEAEELGVVMSADAINSSKEVSNQWRRLTSVARGLRNELGVALAPMVTRVFQGLVDWTKANRELLSQRITYWVEVLRASLVGLHAAVQLVGGWDVVFLGVAQGAGMLLLISNLGKILDTLNGIKVTFNLIKGAAAAAGVTMSVPFVPLLLVISSVVGILAILALLVEDVVMHFNGGDSTFGRALDRFEAMIPVFGAVRALMWALAQLWMSGANNAILLVTAIVTGLAPAMQLIWLVIEPVLNQLERLLGLWTRLNGVLGVPLRIATEWADSIRMSVDQNAASYTSGVHDRGAAYIARVNDRMSGAVQGQVSGAGATSNATNSSTVNQTNWFNSNGQVDFEAGLASMNRKAAPAVRGGMQ